MKHAGSLGDENLNRVPGQRRPKPNNEPGQTEHCSSSNEAPEPPGDTPKTPRPWPSGHDRSQRGQVMQVQTMLSQLALEQAAHILPQLTAKPCPVGSSEPLSSSASGRTSPPPSCGGSPAKNPNAPFRAPSSPSMPIKIASLCFDPRPLTGMFTSHEFRANVHSEAIAPPGPAMSSAPSGRGPKESAGFGR